MTPRRGLALGRNFYDDITNYKKKYTTVQCQIYNHQHSSKSDILL